MPYIGNKSDTAFTSLLKQDLTGASGTSLTLTHAVANANDIALYINNVRQEPTTAYTASGTAVSLTGSVASSDDIYLIYLARAVQTTVTPDASVTSAKLADNAVITAKIADDAVNLTSKVTGVLPVANSQTNTPAFRAIRTSALAQTQNNQTLMLYNAEQYDTHNAYNTSNGRFTPQVAGKYFVNMSIGMDGLGASNTLQLVLKVNGADWAVGYTVGGATFQLASVITLDADDYVTAHFKTNCASSVTVTGQAPKTHFEAFKLIGA